MPGPQSLWQRIGNRSAPCTPRSRLSTRRAQASQRGRAGLVHRRGHRPDSRQRSAGTLQDCASCAPATLAKTRREHLLARGNEIGCAVRDHEHRVRHVTGRHVSQKVDARADARRRRWRLAAARTSRRQRLRRCVRKAGGLAWWSMLACGTASNALRDRQTRPGAEPDAHRAARRLPARRRGADPRCLCGSEGWLIADERRHRRDAEMPG